MDNKQGRTLLTLRSVDVFLDAHVERLPIATTSGVRQRFADRLAELELHVETQAASPLVAQGLTRVKQSKRDALLRDYMAPIARIARLTAATIPALTPVKMPRGAPGVHKLLAHAEGMAVIAEEYRDVFIAAGLCSSFVEDLRSAIDDIRSTLARRTGKYGDQAGASEGLGNSLVACNRYKAVLDSFIRSEACDDAELLAEWSAIKRVPRPAGPRRKRAAAAPATAPAATPAVPQPEQAAANIPIIDASRLLGSHSTVQTANSLPQMTHSSG
jgi:hypothetical protein